MENGCSRMTLYSRAFIQSECLWKELLKAVIKNFKVVSLKQLSDEYLCISNHIQGVKSKEFFTVVQILHILHITVMLSILPSYWGLGGSPGRNA